MEDLEMDVKPLQGLAEQFCSIAGMPVPDITPDPQGIVAFSLRMQDVEASIAHDPVRHPGHFFVMVFFGPVHPMHEAAANRELLHANLLMLAPDAPAFSRNPLTGDVVLQYSWPVAQASGQGLLEALQRIVPAVAQWRVDHFLDPAAILAGAAARPQEGFV